MRLYLKETAKIETHSSIPDKFAGTYVQEDARGKYVEAGCTVLEGGSLADEHRKHIKEVSAHENFYCGDGKSSRENGIYNFRSATAVVERGRDAQCTVRILSDDIDDAGELYRLIRAGEIRPITSFAQTQIDYDSTRSILKLLITVVFRRLDDLHFRLFQS